MGEYLIGPLAPRIIDTDRLANSRRSNSSNFPGACPVDTIPNFIVFAPHDGIGETRPGLGQVFDPIYWSSPPVVLTCSIVPCEHSLHYYQNGQLQFLGSCYTLRNQAHFDTIRDAEL